MEIVLATRNSGKVQEVRAALEGLPVLLLSLEEAGVESAAEESSGTYFENARQKAEAAARASGRPALADDSGIEVKALPGELGVLSARFGGGGLDDAGRNRLLLERLEGVAEADRGARYVCALALCFPDGRCERFDGEQRGRILSAPRGEGGFGYDPLFYLPERGCTVAEIDLATKNRLSHRGKALAALKEWLAGELAEVKD